MTPSNNTMHKRLLRLLKARYITPLDALRHVGCLSLSQRCGELRKAGVKVADKWVKLGNGKRVKAYKVVG